MQDDFSPIEHEELALLNESLEKARALIHGTNEDKLSAVLIIVNHVEYISQHLLRNLRRVVRVATHHKFNGVIFWPNKEKTKPLTLGQAISELKSFNFPDREDLLRHLNEFNKRRNDFVHRLLQRLNVEEKEVESILTSFDNIFRRYDAIRKELLEKWPEPE